MITYDGSYKIETEIQYCTVKKDGLCKLKSELNKLNNEMQYCYDDVTKRLYLVVERFENSEK